MLTPRVACLSLAAVLALPAAAGARGSRVPQRANHASVIERLEALEAAVALLGTDQHSLRDQATSLEEGVASLESDVQAIKDNQVIALNPYLGVIQDRRGPLVRLTGVNLQIVNGTNPVGQINGLGNLIVGYDETAPEGSAPWCGTPPFGQPCVAYKLGSHNIVGGSYNSYRDEASGGLVAGTANILKGPYTSVTAGAYNRAVYGSISGGERNTAEVWASSVSGGADNHAEQGSISGGHYNAVADGGSVSGGEFNRSRGASAPDCDSVSGGFKNQAGTQEGGCGTVSGGAFNLAGGPYSSISGGEQNRTTADGYGDYATISGGDHNVALFFHSSISGGSAHSTGHRYSDHTMTAVAITGGHQNDGTGGSYSSISGGKDRTAAGDYNWVAGSLLEPF